MRFNLNSRGIFFFSCFAVWALGADGNIYRRFGISPTNFIGDYWMQVPGLLSLICGRCFTRVTFQLNLWGKCVSWY